MAVDNSRIYGVTVSAGGDASRVTPVQIPAGGAIDSITIGATTPSTGAFTTLSASSTVSGAGFTSYFASPPAIGGTAPSTGAFTTIKTSGYTVATLPVGSAGMRAYVTDALNPTFLGALTGGGAVVTPVFHNGTAWVAG